MDKKEIRPVKVKDLPRFLKACEPIADAFMAGDIKAAIMQHADNVIEATAIGAGIEREWLGEQELDVLVELTAKVIEVNIDFFVQTLLPKIQAVGESLGEKTKDLGITTG
ncbi:MAG: hypothetical protein RBR42_05080 [Desulfomicrobium sp.]|nr:hypothetical protein [Desulfomicrobium sp.]